MKAVVVGCAAAVAGVLMGRALFGGGVPLEELARVAHERDSAIVLLTTAKQVAALVPELADSVKHYRGRAEIAGRVEVKRPPVVVHDTVTMAPDTVEMPQRYGSMGRVVFPPIDSAGVIVQETLLVAPRPAAETRFTRSLSIGFRPDTLAVALLRMPNGLTRLAAVFNAEAQRAGVTARVVDAAAVSAGSKKRSAVWRVVGAASCLLAGHALADGKTAMALPAAGGCVLSAL